MKLDTCLVFVEKLLKTNLNQENPFIQAAGMPIQKNGTPQEHSQFMGSPEVKRREAHNFCSFCKLQDGGTTGR